MLFRKIAATIENHFHSGDDKIMLVNGARQIGKSFIIRDVCKRTFKNYVEVNLLEDSIGERRFADVRTKEKFYIRLSMLPGAELNDRSDTVIFLDEIQVYPHLLTLLKFLREDGRYSYIASGSQLGIALAETPSVPIGSVLMTEMFPLDFEEFLIANGFKSAALKNLRKLFDERCAPDQTTHNLVMDLWRKYLFVGGLPDAVNTYLATFNVVKVRAVQRDIHALYQTDAAKYDSERRLKIRRIYDMLPSVLENKKKRIHIQDIEDKRGKCYNDYADEFDYLVNAGIALEVRAVSTPVFPLVESSGKNLLKLYLNDVGLLTNELYGIEIDPLLEESADVNLGNVYESAVASELRAHGHRLFYYDNCAKGEVDFLIDDRRNRTSLPIEVKSGRDYTAHAALNRFVANPDYHIREAIVLSNAAQVTCKNSIVYLPVYFSMFI